jgi:hypothetical protein
VRPKCTAFLCQRSAISKDSPSLSTLDDLGAVETECCCVAERAERAPAETSAVSLTCVPDQAKTAGAGEVSEPGRVSRASPQVDRQHSFGPGTGLRGQVVGVHPRAITVTVDENWPGTAVQDGRSRHDDGQGRDEDFIAGADAASQQGAVNRCGAAIDRNHVSGTEHLGQF